MRIYEITDNWEHEIQRDVLKRGQLIKADRMQDANVKDNPDFDTKEFLNYNFCLLDVGDETKIHAKFTKLCDRQWCIHEFNERISNTHENPGTAWRLRKEVWAPFMVRNNGKFAYTYNERIRTQLTNVINLLKQHPSTRQAIVSIWDRSIDAEKIGLDRVPCSMYYHFIFRDGKLHLIYNMRSCDIFTHYYNDIYLAIKLLQFVAQRTMNNAGNLYMHISSLHAYRKDFKKLGEVF